jgi:hypothetical protein
MVFRGKAGQRGSTHWRKQGGGVSITDPVELGALEVQRHAALAHALLACTNRGTHQTRQVEGGGGREKMGDGWMDGWMDEWMDEWMDG